MICEKIVNVEDAGKKNCLLILPRPVFPVVSGYSNKNYHLIPALARQYNLHIAVLTFEPLSEDEIEYDQNFVISLTEFRLNRFGSYLRAGFSLLSPEPLQAGYYYDPRAARMIREMAAKTDLVIGTLIRSEKYLRQAGTSKIRIFDMVDSIGMNYCGSCSAATGLLRRSFYQLEGRRLLRRERLSVAAYDCTFFVNYREERQFRRFGNTVWLPHGVKEELFSYTAVDARYSHSVVFIGKMNYRPNIEAVKWYVKNVHGRFHGEIPLIIVGAYPTKEIREMAVRDKSITVTGYCDDPYLYLNSGMAVIAPMRTGGGIQNKVLEGMALGKICVISSLAAGPVRGGEDGKHFIVADSPDNYEFVLRQIAASPGQYASLGENARRLIKEKFTWSAFCETYIETCEKAAEFSP